VGGESEREGAVRRVVDWETFGRVQKKISFNSNSYFKS
jgi:hypothetical protein